MSKQFTPVPDGLVTFDPYCQTCGVEVDLVFWCPDCAGYVCVECIAEHETCPLEGI